MLLYSMLHLSGYDLPMEQLQQFRQWGSRTPGHPEVHLTPGVEVTTGPLGQGISNAVGVAASTKMLGARFNDRTAPSPPRARVRHLLRRRHDGGHLRRGAAAWPGTSGSDNLVFFYDDNKITIDGSTQLAFSEDVGKRYEAYGWFVQHIDGHDHAQIRAALDRAVAEPARPSLIVARTHIRHRLAQAGQRGRRTASPSARRLHARHAKAALGWPETPFYVPDEVRALFAERAEDGKKEHAAWKQAVAAFTAKGGPAADLYAKLMARAVPANLFEELCKAAPTKDAATRAQSGIIEKNAPPRSCPRWWAARPTSTPPPRPTSRARPPCPRATSRAATSTSASASTPWARS